MLTALRNSAKSWVAKVLIALLVVSFAIWGVSDVVTGFGANTVAEAGDTEIDALTFQRDYQNMVQRMSQQMGRGVTPDQSRALGIPQQVLGNLVTEALILDAASEFNVGVSDAKLAASVRDNESFQGPGGTFDRFLFERILISNGFTEETFLEAERRQVAREQLASGLVGGLRTPSPWIQALNTYQNEERTVSFVRLTRDSVGPVADPSSGELQGWFDENADQFRAPEYRRIEMIDLEPEAIADPAEVPIEEVRRAYDTSTQFGEPERRQVRQIVFNDTNEAQQALSRVQGGETFEDLAASLERSMEDIDLGLVERTDILDPAVADAAFQMGAGEAQVVDGRFGPVLVQTAEIEPARKRPFEDVSEQIRAEIALDRAVEEAIDLYDLVEDAFAGGAGVTEVANRFGLPVRTIDAVDRRGLAPDGSILTLPASNQLLTEVFGTDIGVENAPIDIDRTHYVWFRVTDIMPARDRTLDEVESEALAAWTADRIGNGLRDRAAEVARRLEAGETAEDIAAAIPGATAGTSGPFTRADLSARGELPESAANAAFGGPEGFVTNLPAEDGSHMVIEVTNVTQPVFFEGAADLVPIEEELTRALGDTLLTEYVNALQQEKGVTVNQPLIDQIVGGGRMGGNAGYGG